MAYDPETGRCLLPLTVSELIGMGASVQEAMWIVMGVPYGPHRARLVSVDGFQVRFEEVPVAWCAWCGDEFDPVEYVTLNQDEPNYCSDDCERAAQESEEGYEAYAEARHSGAPVF